MPIGNCIKQTRVQVRVRLQVQVRAQAALIRSSSNPFHFLPTREATPLSGNPATKGRLNQRATGLPAAGAGGPAAARSINSPELITTKSLAQPPWRQQHEGTLCGRSTFRSDWERRCPTLAPLVGSCLNINFIRQFGSAHAEPGRALFAPYLHAPLGSSHWAPSSDIIKLNQGKRPEIWSEILEQIFIISGPIELAEFATDSQLRLLTWPTIRDS